MTTRQRKGTRKTTTIVETPVVENDLGEENQPVGEFELSLEQVQDLETLNNVLEQYGVEEGVLFKVYQIVNGIQRYKYENPKLDEQYIQQHLGGGDFVARLFINGKYKRSINVAVDALEETDKPNGGRDSHSVFLEKMLMALLMKEHKPAAGNSVNDLVQALGSLDAMRGKQETAMDTFIKGMEMADRFGGRGDGKFDLKRELIDIAKDNAPALIHAVNSGLALRGGGPMPPAPPPQNATTAPDPNPQPTQEQLEQQMNFMLRSAIGMLKQQCAAQVQVESVIDLVMGNFTNPQYQPMIIQFAAMDFQDLVKLDAQIGNVPFNIWFQSLHDGLRSALASLDTMGDDSGGSAGDVVDIGRN